MANDVSHFYVRDDPTKYSFDDADAEERITDETERAETAEQTNAANIGTLSSLTTAAKSNLVAAINEVDAGVDAITSKFSGPTWNKDLANSHIAYTKFAGIVTISNYENIGIDVQANTWTTLGTLPSGYRPSRPIDVACTVGYNANMSGVIRITTAGNITLWSYNALTPSTAYLSFTVSYPV